MSTTEFVSTAMSDDDVVTAYARNWVLSHVFEDMLKKPDDDGDDDSQGVSVANEVNKSIALCLAQGITGFGT